MGEKPTISCPDYLEYIIDDDYSYAGVIGGYFDALATVSDNCPDPIELISNNIAVTCDNCGTYVHPFRAVDFYGNSAECKSIVTIEDIPATITCREEITVNLMSTTDSVEINPHEIVLETVGGHLVLLLFMQNQTYLQLVILVEIL